MENKTRISRPLSFGILLALLLAGLGSAPFQPVHSAAGPAAISAASRQSAGDTCRYLSSVDSLLDQVSATQWETWVRQLSGDLDVSVGGQVYRLQTRYSYALFDETLGDGRSRAFDFVRQQLLEWYPQSQIEEDDYQPYYGGPTWKNLILTIPGIISQQGTVILSAHLDSTSGSPYTLAPGADDNASGSATLLEAARVLRDHPQPHPIRLIWFTGEEQYLKGSGAYVADHNLGDVAGVINLDMFGYDGDNDRCLELHVGTLPASDRVGQCFVDSIAAYNIDLKYDYLTATATNRSDHASFWNHNIGAIEVLENVFTDNLPSGCGKSDENPYYHTTSDTFDHLNRSFSFAVAQAALAAGFSLANLDYLEYYFPLVRN